MTAVVKFPGGYLAEVDAEGLRSATDTEADAPSSTGKALDEYAAENAQKLFGPAGKGGSDGGRR